MGEYSKKLPTFIRILEQYSNFFSYRWLYLKFNKNVYKLCPGYRSKSWCITNCKKNFSKKFIKNFKMTNENGKISSIRWLFNSIFNQSYKIYKFRRVFLCFITSIY